MTGAARASGATPAGEARAAVIRLLERDDPEGALLAATELARTRPGPSSEVLRARALARLRRPDEAQDALAQALAADPAHVEANFELGMLHKQGNELELAAACFALVLRQDPEHADALYELGWIRQEQRRLPEALAHLERARAIRPEDLRILNQLAYVLVALERFEPGIALFEEICARTAPAVVRPRINLSNALLRIGRFERALEVIDALLAVEPNNVEGRWNRAHLMLAMGRYDEGWRDYDARVLLRSRPARLVPFREWEGGPLDGRTLFVSAEQGLGDELMFASCVPDLLARGARLHLECEHRLAALFARAFPGVTLWPSDHETLPPFLERLPDIDLHARAGSLPRYLRARLEDFPERAAYLLADPEKVARWQLRLAALGPGPKIGISWRGGTAATRTSMRSMRLEDLDGLLARADCRFVSLQYGEVGPELDAAATRGVRIAHWQEAIDDFDETAALLQALDGVVSVQTAVIHLAGALGRPVSVLLPSAPEWRYGLAGARMPWYPSVRLYRQETPGDWRAPLAAAMRVLDERFMPGAV
jgi:tetratricopeptide (TPR) repeat protein